jgi:hypothetical protein
VAGSTGTSAGANVNGTMSTTAMDNVWVTVVSRSVALTAGPHVMKFAVEAPDADWNWNTRVNYFDVLTSEAPVAP